MCREQRFEFRPTILQMFKEVLQFFDPPVVTDEVASALFALKYSYR
jgi:hypothetical protein